MADIPERSPDPPLCWEIENCDECQSKGKADCPEFQEEDSDES